MTRKLTFLLAPLALGGCVVAAPPPQPHLGCRTQGTAIACQQPDGSWNTVQAPPASEAVQAPPPQAEAEPPPPPVYYAPPPPPPVYYAPEPDYPPPPPPGYYGGGYNNGY